MYSHNENNCETFHKQRLLYFHKGHINENKYSLSILCIIYNIYSRHNMYNRLSIFNKHCCIQSRLIKIEDTEYSEDSGDTRKWVDIFDTVKSDQLDFSRLTINNWLTRLRTRCFCSFLYQCQYLPGWNYMTGTLTRVRLVEAGQLSQGSSQRQRSRSTVSRTLLYFLVVTTPDSKTCAYCLLLDNSRVSYYFWWV